MRGYKKAVVGIRFSNRKYRLRVPCSTDKMDADENETLHISNLTPLPYRYIYALITKDSLLIHDTQSYSPIAVIGNMHYSALTDVAWSGCGNRVMVSSRDGYCSVVEFEAGELGDVITVFW